MPAYSITLNVPSETALLHARPHFHCQRRLKTFYKKMRNHDAVQTCTSKTTQGLIVFASRLSCLNFVVEKNSVENFVLSGIEEKLKQGDRETLLLLTVFDKKI